MYYNFIKKTPTKFFAFFTRTKLPGVLIRLLHCFANMLVHCHLKPSPSGHLQNPCYYPPWIVSTPREAPACYPDVTLFPIHILDLCKAELPHFCIRKSPSLVSKVPCYPCVTCYSPSKAPGPASRENSPRFCIRSCWTNRQERVPGASPVSQPVKLGNK